MNLAHSLARVKMYTDWHSYSHWFVMFRYYSTFNLVLYHPAYGHACFTGTRWDMQYEKYTTYYYSQGRPVRKKFKIIASRWHGWERFKGTDKQMNMYFDGSKIAVISIVRRVGELDRISIPRTDQVLLSLIGCFHTFDHTRNMATTTQQFVKWIIWPKSCKCTLQIDIIFVLPRRWWGTEMGGKKWT
jgi:hypothetical protein